MITDIESLAKLLPKHAKRLEKKLSQKAVKEVQQYEPGGTVWVEVNELRDLQNLPSTRRLKPRVTFFVDQTAKLDAQRAYREARRKTS